MRSLLTLCLLGGAAALAALKGHDPHELGHEHSHEQVEPVLEVIDGIAHYEVVDMNSLRSKSTLSAEGYMEHVFSEMKFSAYQQHFHLLLEQNHKLFGPNYYEQRQSYDEKKVFIGRDLHKPVHNCHYHGHFANQTRQGDTLVVVSNCNSHGFKGMAKAADGEWYGFEAAHPHLSKETLDTHHRRLLSTQHKATLSRRTGEDMDLHIVYKLTSVEVGGEATCGVKSTDHDYSHDQHKHTLSVRDEINSITRQGRVLAQSSGATQTVDKYVELLVINDKARYDQWLVYCETPGAPDPCRVEDDSVRVVNAVNVLYLNGKLEPNINVVLVSQITMRISDPWEAPERNVDDAAEVNASSYLGIVHNWRSKAEQSVVDTDPVQLVEVHDNCQLFSGLDFNGFVLGLASLGAMCSPRSGGINQVASPATTADMVTVAHEMGHNFGMRHDSDGNTCAESGNIMNARTSAANPPDLFSSCSKTYFSAYIDSNSIVCLDNTPIRRWGDPDCGNGFIEVGEDCDCGASDCTGLDACCNGATCKLAVGAQCSSADACCQETCDFALNTTVCRPAVNECDLPDQCDGKKSTCPLNRVAGAGYECSGTFGAGLCYGGNCMSVQRQCTLDLTQYTAQTGFEYEPCTADTLAPADACSELRCQPVGKSSECATYAYPDAYSLHDGTPCGGGLQCKDASCGSQARLTPNFIWDVGSWESCTSCEAAQNRLVMCEEITALSSYVVDDKACSPGARRKGSRMCVNDTLGCAGANDNEAVAYARTVSEELNLLDQAGELRARIPRVGGYPTEFDLDDEEYIKGILLLGAVPAAIAVVCLLYMLAYCCCNCGCGDTEQKAHPHEGTKKLLLWVILFLLSLVCCVFACVALFCNSELNRAAVAESTGIVPLMEEMLVSAITATTKFKVPLDFIVDSKSDNLDPALEVLTTVSGPLAKAGVRSLTIALTTYAALVAELSVTAVPANGTATAITLSCGTFCANADARTTTIVTEMETELAPIYGKLDDTITTTATYMEDLGASLSSPASQYGSFPQIKVAVDTALISFEDLQGTVEEYRDMLNQANSIRYPATAILCCFPLFMLVAVLLAGLCRKVFLYKTVADVGWVMLVVFWLLLAVHLPMAAVMGDSCEFLNKAEVSTSTVTGLSSQESAVLVACIAGESIVGSLNLTSQIRLMNASITVLTDPLNRPNVTGIFDSTGQLLAGYGTVVTALAYSDFGLNISLKSARLVELNTAAGTSLTLDNYASYVSSDADVVLMINEINQLVKAEVLVDASIKEVTDAWQTIELRLWTDQKVGMVEMQAGMDTATEKLETVLESAFNLEANGDCGNLDETYVAFKTMYCGTLTSSISFLMLAFFMLGMLVPLEIFNAIRESTYIHPKLDTNGKVVHVKPKK